MHIGNLKGKIISVGKDYFLIEKLSFEERPLPEKVVVPSVFHSSLQETEKGSNVQLVDITVDTVAHCLLPKLVIIEPDYLLDVSSVAECMREYGSHPFYFLLSRCSEKANTAPILLGNAANFFLDELIYAENVDSIDAGTTIKKYFQLSPLEISFCKDLRDRPMELLFFQSLKLHFEHLKSIVQSVFKEKRINRRSVVLEPSFICPDIGLQGRLDLLEHNGNKHRSTVIELKSGKTPYGDYTHQAIGLNHRTQASLYQLMIQEVLDVAFSRLETYICYSRCGPEANPLRLAHPSMSLIAEALNIRNHIALNDYKVAFKKIKAETLFSHIVPERMVRDHYLDTKLVRQYVAPHIGKFSSAFQEASSLESAYFFRFYQFLLNEQWLSKCGTGTSKERSLSALWTLDAESKIALGRMVEGLRIVHMETQYNYTTVTFAYRINYDAVADFREGDIVVLYEKNQATDNVTSHQVFKGNICTINETEIVLRLRNHQHSQTFPRHASYAIEHDVSDNNFTAQFRGLYSFLSAPKQRRGLVLGLRKPATKEKPLHLVSGHVHAPAIRNLIQKVHNAEELFLLVGPPGTGKTSIALKSLVDFYYREKESCILLTAYTNRAVDEICLAVETIIPAIDYVRLGSHVNTPARYHNRLLSEQLKRFANRREVQLSVQKKRVYVGTVSAIAANTELLAHKHFDLAIVDEASQILDPQILHLLCSRNEKGDLGIDKFVLIGDEKQLPAVCMQASENFDDGILADNGIHSGKISFFERMLRLYQKDENLVAVLDKQGRMHPDIAFFSNHFFYDSCLSTVPVAHQAEPLHWAQDSYQGHKKTIAEHRVGFVPVNKNAASGAKEEAISVAECAQSVWELYQEHNMHFDTQYSLGIITPFRSQVALIKKCLRDLDIPQLDDIIVDTVERYQGSQKDIIVYAFGVYHPAQLQQVTDATTVLDGKTIDRKLNVALTRARKQFFFVGSEYWIQQNELYAQLVHYLKTGVT